MYLLFRSSCEGQVIAVQNFRCSFSAEVEVQAIMPSTVDLTSFPKRALFHIMTRTMMQLSGFLYDL
jgi:hypothetical protein